jgi:hypothetical protein
MRTLMYYCKADEAFLEIYIIEGSTHHFNMPATSANTLCISSRGHNNEYATVDYLNWS